MSFDSHEFIFVFLPITVVGFYLIGKLESKKWVKIWLLICSLFFYGYVSRMYLMLIFASVMMNYCLGSLMGRFKSTYDSDATEKQITCGVLGKKILLVLGLIFNIGLLVYFKYTDFLISSINVLFSTEYELLKVVAPLGVSFFTFKQIAYIVDAYKNKEMRYSLLDYANYILLFPQILSGPISLHDDIIPQLLDVNTYRYQSDNFSAGIYQFSLGLAKKVLVADVLARFVELCFVNRPSANSTMALLGIIAYTMQIYYDFSGYSDMAIGIARLFNIKTKANFNSPYKAVSISDFWRRWHISLTSFFTKYLYIPLGGNRKGNTKTYFNTLIVFLVSGIWHGANWTFILWGVMNGILLVVTKICKITAPKRVSGRLLGRISTFMAVSLLWCFFRADSIDAAWGMLKELFSFHFIPLEASVANVFMTPGLEFCLKQWGLIQIGPFLPYIFLGVVVLITQVANNVEENILTKRYQSSFHAAFSAILIIVCIISFSTVSKFIYWNF